MKDTQDPGTAELDLKRRPGRPPKHGEAMTPAERAKAYRARRGEQAKHGRLAPVDHRIEAKTSTAALLDTLRDCFAQNDRVNATRLLQLLKRRADAMKDVAAATDD